MSHSYGATISRLKNVGHYTSNGTQFKHHWLISQDLMKKYPSLLPLGNQTWNLTIFKSQASHMRWAHGQIYAGIGYSSYLTNSLYLVTSTPTWFKTGVAFGTKNLINE